MARASLLTAAVATALVQQATALTISLNDANFTPRAFEPASNVVEQHKALARSTNVIVLPLNNDDGTGSEDWEPYWMGLLIVPIVIVVMFLLWFVGLCIQPFCKCNYRKDPVVRFRGYVAFCVLSVASLIAWICCFAIDDGLQESIGSVKGNLVDIQRLVHDWQTLLEETLVTTEQIAVNVTETADICRNATAEGSDARKAIDTAVTVIMDYLNTADDGIEEALGYFPDVDKVIDQVVDAPAETVASVVILTWGLLMFFLVLFLLAATSIQFLNPGAYHAKRFKRCLARTSCLTVFTVGLLFIALSVALACILHAVSTAGSDVCGPNPDYTFQRFISEADGSPILEPRRRGGEADLCQPIPNSAPVDGDQDQVPPGIAFLLCFYQTCEGDTVILETLEDLAELANNWTWPTLPGDAPEVCADSYDALVQTTIVTATEIVLAAVDLFRCNRINPIYTAVVHDSFCNSMVSTSVSAWKFFLTGSVFLLLAMGVQRHFYLGKTRNHLFKRGARARYGAEHTNSTDFDANDSGDEDEIASQYRSHNTSMLTDTPRASAKLDKAESVGSGSDAGNPYAPGSESPASPDNPYAYRSGSSSSAASVASTAPESPAQSAERGSIVML